MPHISTLAYASRWGRITTLIFAVFAVTGTAAGCSDTTTQPLPTATVTPYTSVSVPATVTGPKWCSEMYTYARGTAMGDPQTKAANLTLIADTASAEGDSEAAAVIAEYSAFLKAQPVLDSTASPSPDYTAARTGYELEQKMQTQFANNCGGKSLTEAILGAEPSPTVVVSSTATPEDTGALPPTAPQP